MAEPLQEYVDSYGVNLRVDSEQGILRRSQADRAGGRVTVVGIASRL